MGGGKEEKLGGDRGLNHGGRGSILSHTQSYRPRLLLENSCVCIHKKHGSKVYRIAEHFGLFSKFPGGVMI